MSTLRTEEMTLNMGPQHPSTHGVLRFIVRADGEVMREAVPDVGYLHRSIEKIAEKVGYHGFMPYTDRVDYVCAMFTNQGWGMACEKLGQYRSSQARRVLPRHRGRVQPHRVASAFGRHMAMDIGAMTPFTHALREREMINDLIEELCGARLTFNYMRIGGVAFDLPPGWREKALAYLDHFEPILGRVQHAHLVQQNLYRAAGQCRRDHRRRGDRLQPGRSEPARLRLQMGRPQGHSLFGLSGFRVRRSGRRRANGASSATRWIATWCAFSEMARVRRRSCARRWSRFPTARCWPRCRATSSRPPANARSASRAPAATWDGTRSATAPAIRGACMCAPGRSPRWGSTQKLSRGLMIADLVTLIASLDVIAPEIDR